ncbi:MAG TPA: RNA polymerase sigma factor [Pseudomonadales bacterium]
MSKVVRLFKQDCGVETLILPHFSALYSQAYKYTANRATAQDLVQDVFVYALENRRKVLELDPVLPWLMRCLYHRFVDQFRRNRSDVAQFGDFDFEQTVAPGTSAEDQYFHEQVRLGLAKLSIEQRVAVTLFDIEGYSLEEVCSVMELPLNTVKSHLHRGRRRLKAQLALTGSELERDEGPTPFSMITTNISGDDADAM